MGLINRWRRRTYGQVTQLSPISPAYQPTEVSLPVWQQETQVAQTLPPPPRQAEPVRLEILAWNFASLLIQNHLDEAQQLMDTYDQRLQSTAIADQRFMEGHHRLNLVRGALNAQHPEVARQVLEQWEEHIRHADPGYHPSEQLHIRQSNTREFITGCLDWLEHPSTQNLVTREAVLYQTGLSRREDIWCSLRQQQIQRLQRLKIV
jgi:hypothetical protein